MEISLKDKVALITGASGGIGKATAIKLAQCGAKLALGGRNLEKLLQVQNECLKYTQEVETFQVDLEIAHEIYDFVFKVISKFSTINIVVSIAGTLENRGKKFWEIDAVKWRKTFEVNLFANVDLIQSALPYLKKEPYSKIILISSNIGLRPAGFSSDYCASKAALINFGQSLAVELAPFKILTNVICPGPVRTDMLKLSHEVEETIKNYIPLKKIGEPEDVAHLITFLASDYANWLTGSIFVIDGGALLAYAKN
ncbi:MAG: SDR family NAD(P)-dependent oxidoreductase [Planctomycetota bacterium]